MTVLTLYRLLLVVALSQAFTSCYYPDSIYTASDQPCIVNGTHGSFCCGSQGILCLSDKVSYCNHSSYSTSGNSYARGSCTDQSFRSPACPQFSLDAYFWCMWVLLTDNVAAAAPDKSASGMFQCIYTTDFYCCSADGSPYSCEDGNIAWLLHQAMYLRQALSGYQ